MNGNCARWLELLAAYKAGERSNEGVVDADTDRAKVDAVVAGESDSVVADKLSKWRREQ
jgi:hypothetical protein